MLVCLFVFILLCLFLLLSGTHLGGCSMLLAFSLRESGATGRRHFGFDSFQGLPPFNQLTDKDLQLEDELEKKYKMKDYLGKKLAIDGERTAIYTTQSTQDEKVNNLARACY